MQIVQTGDGKQEEPTLKPSMFTMHFVSCYLAKNMILWGEGEKLMTDTESNSTWKCNAVLLKLMDKTI